MTTTPLHLTPTETLTLEHAHLIQLSETADFLIEDYGRRLAVETELERRTPRNKEQL